MICNGPPEDVRVLMSEGYEKGSVHARMRFQERRNLSHRDFACQRNRESERTGADARKGYRLCAVGGGQLKRRPISGGEQLWFTSPAAPPHRAHRVYYESSGKPETVGDAGLAGRAANSGPRLGDCPAGVEQLGAGGGVDGAVDPAASQHSLVGGVDDGVNLLSGDVPNDEMNARRSGSGQLIAVRRDARATR